VDIEALKLRPDAEDPVPEYTLVSGLPSYEAALELLQKSPQSSCLIVYPSVFNVFNKQERSGQELQHPGVATSAPPASAAENVATPQAPSFCEATMPLLPATATPATATATATPATVTSATSPTCEAIKPNFVMMPIVPSYAEVFGSSYKTVDEKKKSKSKDSQVKDDVKR